MDETPQLQLGQHVEIGGRTMLRPGFSLVGLTGVVFVTLPNTPPGCTTVAVDWPKHGYTPANGYPEGSLPDYVNVPTEQLEIVGTGPVTPLFSLAPLLSGKAGREPVGEEAPEPMAPKAKRPGLHLVGDAEAAQIEGRSPIAPPEENLPQEAEKLAHQAESEGESENPGDAHANANGDDDVPPPPSWPPLRMV